MLENLNLHNVIGYNKITGMGGCSASPNNPFRKSTTGSSSSVNSVADRALSNIDRYGREINEYGITIAFFQERIEDGTFFEACKEHLPNMLRLNRIEDLVNRSGISESETKWFVEKLIPVINSYAPGAKKESSNDNLSLAELRAKKERLTKEVKEMNEKKAKEEAEAKEAEALEAEIEALEAEKAKEADEKKVKEEAEAKAIAEEIEALEAEKAKAIAEEEKKDKAKAARNAKAKAKRDAAKAAKEANPEV